MQTTSIDEAAGLIRLTTVLAHTSGEWISSDWPVCPVSETAAPHRMGAALTYARRYALFTLVGIAGEDDLDAPDLEAVAGTARPIRRTGRLGKPQTGTLMPPGHRQFPPPGPRYPLRVPPILAADPSAQLRDRLLAELGDLQSSDEAADWANRSLPAKNTLIVADAQLVEDGFRIKMAALGRGTARRSSARPPKTRMRQPKNPGNLVRQGLRTGRGRHSGQDHPPARQGPPQIRLLTALPGVRPFTRRRPPSALCPASSARPQGQRRVHCPGVPCPSSRVAPAWRRGRVVARDQDRSAADRAQALAARAARRHGDSR